MAAVALLPAVAGCATPSYHTPVEVTRFTAQPAGAFDRGAIDVRAAPGEADTGLAFDVYRNAVSRELASLGFNPTAAGAPYVALVDVERWVAKPGGKRSPVSVGGGASTGTYGSGVGLGIGLNLSPDSPEEIDTQLSVSIRPAVGGAALWEGRARFTATANNELAQLDAAAARLATALFQGFPGTSGETIEVE